uniref:Uncharacterized protein n=1 Tax=Arundo donax TaxID=35708 RepID=A0A0A9BEA6_ARUDO
MCCMMFELWDSCRCRLIFLILSPVVTKYYRY